MEQQSLQGKLDVVLGCNSQYQTILRRRFRKGLFHFGKSYPVGDSLILQILNPTAGIFEGDSLESEVVLERNAKACLLSPSATQVYRMPGKGGATSRQFFSLKENSSMVFLPKSLVLHGGSSLWQSTEIRMVRGASLFFLEQISAGRLAYGEFLRYQCFDGRVSVFLDDKILLRERMRCGEGRNQWIWSMKGRSGSVMANFYICFPGAAKVAENLMGDLVEKASASFIAGFSPIDEDFVVVRTLSDGHSPLHAFTRSLSQLLYQQFPSLEICNRLV